VISQRDVAVPTHVRIGLGSSVVYDGHTSIFTTEFSSDAVHVWSVSGQYDRQLVSLRKLLSYFWFIAVDVQRHVMYICQKQGRIDVFELTYEPL
jgi:peptide methionine sulfoxide reductase MsrA